MFELFRLTLLLGRLLGFFSLSSSASIARTSAMFVNSLVLDTVGKGGGGVGGSASVLGIDSSCDAKVKAKAKADASSRHFKMDTSGRVAHMLSRAACAQGESSDCSFTLLF